MNDSTSDPSSDSGTDPASSVPVTPVRPDTVRRQNGIAMLGTVALAVALAFGGGLAVGRATAPGGSAAPSDPGATPGPAPTVVPSAGASLPSEGARLGRADAKVTIEYWADYQCSYCATFAQEVIPKLESRIADGTVALVHRDFAFLGEESVDAAVAVQCAARDGRYWPMHDAVYAAQGGVNGGAFARPRLAQVAASVGLDATAFAACMDDPEPLVAVLDDTAAGVRTGIESTPTVDVNGSRFLGVPDMTVLIKAIDAAVAGASPAPLPTARPSSDPWTGIDTDGRAAGDPAAPVTVELWMDYQSKGSAVIANDLGPELRTRIGTGAIRVQLRDLASLGDESVVAAAMVRCVARQDGPAWFINDILAVSGQGADAGIYTTVNLLRLSSQLGLLVRTLDTCLADAAVAAEVMAETAEGTALGLSAGPSIVIRTGATEVGRFSGDLDVTVVLAAIDAAK